jgi:signal transduction histidine kinase
MAVGDPADQWSLGVFAATGLVISWLNHRLHVARHEEQAATATATARAERLDTPIPKPMPVDLVPLVKTTASLLVEDPALKHLAIDIAGASPVVSGDPHMLTVVFQNLLLNSAQAMHGQGRITVSVDVIDSACQIAVADNGPGIPADVREKVFTPFFTTKTRGSGLGLPTVKRFVEAHNGEIAIDSPPAGGTTFLVRLPLAAAGGQPARP